MAADEKKSLNDQIREENSSTDRIEKTRGRVSIWAVIAFLVLGALLLLVGISLFRAQEGPVAVGSPAPDFVLTTFEGEEISLEDLAGKVVVLNFWASWCKPCEQEAADLESAWRQYQPQGDVVFIGVDWTDTEHKAMRYLEKFEITFPNGPDLGTRISQSYRTTGVPETYIIDRDGNLAYVKLSPFLSLQEITNVIDPLLEY